VLAYIVYHDSLCFFSFNFGMYRNSILDIDRRQRDDCAAFMNLISVKRIKLKVVIFNRWPRSNQLLRLMNYLAFSILKSLDLELNAFIKKDWHSNLVNFIARIILLVCCVIKHF
jgi:hypothetical protein